MGAGNAVKRIGRADQSQQLAGPADAPRELFLSRRSISTFSRRYGLAEPQLLPVGFGTCRANVAWRSAVSINEAQAATSQRGDLGLCQTQDAIAHKKPVGRPPEKGYASHPLPLEAGCRLPSTYLPPPFP